jgi:hypothetical protein
MKTISEDGLRGEARASWSVAVIYEDNPAREWGVGFCDQLVGRFWDRCEFNVGWWSLDMLKDAATAREAAANAAAADIIVVAAAPEGDFPLHAKNWLDLWLDQRGQREGMLVSLTGAQESARVLEGRREAFLRNVAHRAAMDYLTHVPPDLSRAMPDSLDSFNTRAETVTGLLDDILHRPVPPPRTLL